MTSASHAATKTKPSFNKNRNKVGTSVSQWMHVMLSFHALGHASRVVPFVSHFAFPPPFYSFFFWFNISLHLSVRSNKFLPERFRGPSRIGSNREPNRTLPNQMPNGLEILGRYAAREIQVFSSSTRGFPGDHVDSVLSRRFLPQTDCCCPSMERLRKPLGLWIHLFVRGHNSLSESPSPPPCNCLDQSIDGSRAFSPSTEKPEKWAAWVATTTTRMTMTRCGTVFLF